MNSKPSPGELTNKICASFNLDPTTKSLATDGLQKYKAEKLEGNNVSSYFLDNIKLST